MARATSSLPVPDSPRISTVVGVGATRDDLLGQLLHLRVLPDDEVALGLGLQLPEHERVAVLELLASACARRGGPT